MWQKQQGIQKIFGNQCWNPKIQTRYKGVQGNLHLHVIESTARKGASSFARWDVMRSNQLSLHRRWTVDLSPWRRHCSFWIVLNQWILLQVIELRDSMMTLVSLCVFLCVFFLVLLVTAVLLENMTNLWARLCHKRAPPTYHSSPMHRCIKDFMRLLSPISFHWDVV